MWKGYEKKIVYRSLVYKFNIKVVFDLLPIKQTLNNILFDKIP